MREMNTHDGMPEPLGWVVSDILTAATLIGAVLCAVFGVFP